MKARIKWVQDVMFVGESGSGHAVIMDGAPEAGGRNLGIRPMEMVLLGLGGCSAFDVIAILKRGRQAVTDCIVNLDAERATTDPKVFTKIHMHWTVRGRALKRNLVEHAVRLTHEKYCSATAMLSKTAEVTRDFEIIEA